MIDKERQAEEGGRDRKDFQTIKEQRERETDSGPLPCGSTDDGSAPLALVDCAAV